MLSIDPHFLYTLCDAKIVATYYSWRDYVIPRAHLLASWVIIIMMRTTRRPREVTTNRMVRTAHFGNETP